MGSYQDGIFKFIMKIPENFPDGDCPVSIKFNRIYNKILDRDWFSVHLFVTELVSDHVGVQL